MDQKDIDILDDLNDNINNEENTKAVEAVAIMDPATAVNQALTSFLIKKLSSADNGTYMEDAINAAILERLPEATFQDLAMLRHSVAADNNAATATILKSFEPKEGEKTVIDNLRTNNNANMAAQLYSGTTDKKTLQALNYLAQMLGLAEQKNREVEIKTDEEKK